MILFNYLKIKKETYLTPLVDITSDYHVTVNVKNLSGTNVPNITRTLYSAGTDFVGDNWCPRAGLYCRLGTGTDEPGFDDYCLGNDVTSSFSNYTVSINTSSVNGGEKTIFSISGRNNTADPIGVSEIGITKTVYTMYGNSTGNPQTILIAKFLLEDPIAVSPNGDFTLSFEWSDFDAQE